MPRFTVPVVLWPALAALLAAGTAPAQGSRFRPVPDAPASTPGPGPASDAPATRPTPQTRPDGPARRDLPFARGRSFATLDEYLTFRRQGGAIDLPWYQEVAPGIFELRTSMAPPPPAPPPARRFTRAQLLRQFGFSR